jgi:biopolymer transport protein ExbB
MIVYAIAALILVPLALYAGYQLVYCALAIRANQVVPERVVDAFEAHLNAKQYVEAYELAKNDKSVLGQVLAASLASLSQGFESAKVAGRVTLEQEHARLEQQLNRLAVLALAAPICAILVSVFSLTRAFGSYSPASEAEEAVIRAGAADLSAQVADSFLVMGVGLLVCLPAMAAFFLLRSTLDIQMTRVTRRASELLSRFQVAGKR